MVFFGGAYVQQETAILAVNLAAAALILVGFWLYNRSNDQISTGTWFILASGEFVDFGSYWDMVGGDFSGLISNPSSWSLSSLAWTTPGEEWVKSIVPGAFALGTIATFGAAFVQKRFAWPDAGSWFFIFLDAIITAYWLSTGAAATSNLLYQGTTFMAFIPMYLGLLSGKERETFWPWMLWTIAYVGFLGTAVVSFGQQLAELAYPAMGVLTHTIIILFVLRQKKEVRP